MIKQGQIYREKNPPYFRKDEGLFIVSYMLFTNVWIIYQNGMTDRVGFDWIKKDCALLAEFDTWQEAIKHLNNNGE